MAFPNQHLPQLSNGQNKAQVVVVMVPFAAQGHMNQLLHLSRLILQYNIPIHFVSTTLYTQTAKARLQGWDPLSTPTTFHFHEFEVPSFSRSSSTSPALFQPSIDASTYLRVPVAQLLQALAPTAHRLIVIHDFLSSSTVQDIVSIPNGEAYTFQGVSAFQIFTDLWEMFGKPCSVSVDDGTLDDLPSKDSFLPEILKHVRAQQPHVKFMSGIIYDGCRLLEGKYIDLIASKDMFFGLKQWALGPFNPVVCEVTENSNDDQKRHKCLKWLDQQATNSVIYVCFGTTVSLSQQQVEELATGLEKSEQKFIWVLRNKDREITYEDEGESSVELPKGYEERVDVKRGQGFIIRDWAPQLEILAHPSTGGFISHCGWNSLMESITMGVPVAAWPMHSDQPRNAMLIAKGLKIGIVVREWARRHELVTSKTIEKAVRRLMDSKEGDELRKRAGDLGGDVRGSVVEGGVTRAELNSFVAHITSLDRNVCVYQNRDCPPII